MTAAAPIRRLRSRAYEVPTDEPEADGTLAWTSTTIVVVEVEDTDGAAGLGWTYGHQAAVLVVVSTLAGAVLDGVGRSPRHRWRRMVDRVRNIGRQGVAAQAISAVDVALWDLHARRCEQPIVDVLGRRHRDVAAYGSGGFCTYDAAQVAEQLGGWADQGFGAVKMKVARHPDEDLERVRAARQAVGDGVELMVDANGAFTYQQARLWAHRYEPFEVRWFEEPVTSDDPASLARLRREVPPGMEISAGEYGWDPWYFEHLLAVGAVDCPQADVTRCGGFTGFDQVATLASAHHLDLSAHCAPLLSAHAGCATDRFRHAEWFHDHVRIEEQLFDGWFAASEGRLRPPSDRPGLGVRLCAEAAEPFAITDWHGTTSEATAP